MAESRSGYDTEQTIQSVRREVERRERLLKYDGPQRVVHWSDYLKDREENNLKTLQFSSGMAELDSFTDGFQTEEVIVVSGHTRNGKTLLAQTISRNFAIQNIPVVAFSFEVSTGQYLKPFKEHELYHASLFVPAENKSGSINWLEERIMEAKVKYDIRVVIIDHLHYIIDMNPDKMTNNIGAAMRRIKTMAREMNQVIFVICHQEKLKDGTEPSLETIRDSSFIGQECDTALIVHRLPDEKVKKGMNPTYDKGYALVKVDKARRSGSFRKRMTFQKQGQWLEPL